MVVQKSEPNPMLGFFGAFGGDLSTKLEHRALEELSLSSSSQSNSEYSDSDGEEMFLAAAGTQNYIADDRSEQSVTVWAERRPKPSKHPGKKAPSLPPRPQNSKDKSGMVWQNVRGPVWVPSMGLGSIVGIPKKSASPGREAGEEPQMNVSTKFAKKKRKEEAKRRAAGQNRAQSSKQSSRSRNRNENLSEFIAVADNLDDLPEYEQSMQMLQQKLAHLGKIEQEVQRHYKNEEKLQKKQKKKYEEIGPDRSRFETPPWSDEETTNNIKKAANEATQSTVANEIPAVNTQNGVYFDQSDVCSDDDQQDCDSDDGDSLTSSSSLEDIVPPAGYGGGMQDVEPKSKKAQHSSTPRPVKPSSRRVKVDMHTPPKLNTNVESAVHLPDFTNACAFFEALDAPKKSKPNYSEHKIDPAMFTEKKLEKLIAENDAKVRAGRKNVASAPDVARNVPSHVSSKNNVAKEKSAFELLASLCPEEETTTGTRQSKDSNLINENLSRRRKAPHLFVDTSVANDRTTVRKQREPVIQQEASSSSFRSSSPKVRNIIDEFVKGSQTSLSSSSSSSNSNSTSQYAAPDKILAETPPSPTSAHVERAKRRAEKLARKEKSKSSRRAKAKMQIAKEEAQLVKAQMAKEQVKNIIREASNTVSSVKSVFSNAISSASNRSLTVPKTTSESAGSFISVPLFEEEIALMESMGSENFYRVTESIAEVPSLGGLPRELPTYSSPLRYSINTKSSLRSSLDSLEAVVPTVLPTSRSNQHQNKQFKTPEWQTSSHISSTQRLSNACPAPLPPAAASSAAINSSTNTDYPTLARKAQNIRSEQIRSASEATTTKIRPGLPVLPPPVLVNGPPQALVKSESTRSLRAESSLRRETTDLGGNLVPGRLTPKSLEKFNSTNKVTGPIRNYWLESPPAHHSPKPKCFPRDAPLPLPLPQQPQPHAQHAQIPPHAIPLMQVMSPIPRQAAQPLHSAPALPLLPLPQAISQRGGGGFSVGNDWDVGSERMDVQHKLGNSQPLLPGRKFFACPSHASLRTEDFRTDDQLPVTFFQEFGDTPALPFPEMTHQSSFMSYNSSPACPPQAPPFPNLGQPAVRAPRSKLRTYMA